jgi:hypothetical protein
MRLKTAPLKNCYAFSYISMAVFTGFLQQVTYTYHRSFSECSACFFVFARKLSDSFIIAALSEEVEPRRA